MAHRPRCSGTLAAPHGPDMWSGISLIRALSDRALQPDAPEVTVISDAAVRVQILRDHGRDVRSLDQKLRLRARRRGARRDWDRCPTAPMPGSGRPAGSLGRQPAAKIKMIAA